MITPFLNLLNRLSMYKVVSLSLTGLWAVALLLSLIGEIPYSPLSIVLSVVVLFIATYGASLAFGKVFGVAVHGESSYITGLILFFVMTPTLQPFGLAVLALVGVIAAASKFVITSKGRHIFNPAAVAAYAISLTGLGFASWWVATPPLIPITVLLGLLILYKTRRLQLGLVFAITAVPLVLIMLLIEGNTLAEGLALLSSWPFVFFACFMLSEPLTLPPKKWQQMTEAIIVAVLFAIPIHIGDFASSPALALLVGNLIALGFSQRRAIPLKYISRQALTPSTYEFRFAKPRDLIYEPGQYIEITLPHKKSDSRGMRRMFSVTSVPADDYIGFASKFYESASSFKRRLLALPQDTTIHATGISGDFTLPNDPQQPLVFIAGGIGITPFISHLRYLKRLNQSRDIILLYAVTDVTELAYVDVLREAGIPVCVISSTEQSLPVKQWQHIKTTRLTHADINSAVPDIADRVVYISGPPHMVGTTRKAVSRLNAKSVVCDYFTGY